MDGLVLTQNKIQIEIFNNKIMKRKNNDVCEQNRLASHELVRGESLLVP
jgi:hypothetical protein